MKQENFFGLKITSFTNNELSDYINICFSSKKSYVFYGYSLAVLSYLKKHKNYYEVTNSFDLMVTDGRLFYLLAKFFRVSLHYDISIPRLTYYLLDEANNRGCRVFLLGGTSNSNELAIRNLKFQYANLIIDGRDGYFSLDEEVHVINLIKTFQPKIILLGLPTPYKQELSLRLRNEIDGCIIIPCGGMIDVFAGKEKLTPLWIKKLGLASLFRHIQHPKRLPELFIIAYRALWIFSYCAFLKFILKKDKISIPEILSH